MKGNSMLRSEGGFAKHDRPRRPDLGGRSPVLGTKGAVACEHPSAALIGLRVLDAGGTAADACVAMAAAMAVLSLALYFSGRRETAIFVGLWAPTILNLGQTLLEDD